jgi:hypothetical protein
MQPNALIDWKYFIIQKVGITVVVVAAAAPVGMECLAVRSMHVNASCSILRKLIVHDHTYLQRCLLLSK